MNQPKHRVLIIEDNKDLSGALEALLALRGIEVTVARDGISGIELARRLKPSLILLDVMLPKLSGFDVCRILKGDNNVRRTPILVASTLSKEDDIDRIKNLGADFFMKKPYNIDDLLNEITKRLK